MDNHRSLSTTSFQGCSWHRTRLLPKTLLLLDSAQQHTRLSPGSTFWDQLWWWCIFKLAVLIYKTLNGRLVSTIPDGSLPVPAYHYITGTVQRPTSLRVKFQELTQVSVIDHSLLLDHVCEQSISASTWFSTYSLVVLLVTEDASVLLQDSSTSDWCF